MRRLIHLQTAVQRKQQERDLRSAIDSRQKALLMDATAGEADPALLAAACRKEAGEEDSGGEDVWTGDLRFPSNLEMLQGTVFS